MKITGLKMLGNTNAKKLDDPVRLHGYCERSHKNAWIAQAQREGLSLNAYISKCCNSWIDTDISEKFGIDQ